MRRLITLLLITFACGYLGMQAAFADKRVALVIGNAAYTHVRRLANPENDATAVGVLFKSIGFDVVQVKENLGANDFRSAVRDFSEVSRDSDIAVIYFAGHGIEVDGSNYLIPIDAAMKRDIDVEDETVSLDRLLKVLEPAKKLRLVILDACRDNPFADTMKHTLASRSIGRGLAKVEPVGSDTLVAFAARAGSTAADGENADSPFTLALVKHLVTPGLDIRIAFGRVRDEVLSSTGNKQEPFVYGSLGGATVTLASLTTDDRPNTAPNADPDVPASRDYEAAAKVGTKEAWDSFLRKYSSGFYADLARAQRAKLESTRQDPQPSNPAAAAKTTKHKASTTTADNMGVDAAWCAKYWQGGGNARVLRAQLANPINGQQARSIRAILRVCGHE